MAFGQKIMIAAEKARGSAFLTGTCTESGGFQNTVYAGFRFASDGGLDRRTGVSSFVAINANGWNDLADTTGIGGDWEIRATSTGTKTQSGCAENLTPLTVTTPNSGDVLNTWLSLSTSREWYNADFISGGDYMLGSLNIEIRSAYTRVIMASGVFSFLTYDAS